jgi:hypothetical protein
VKEEGFPENILVDVGGYIEKYIGKYCLNM